MTPLEAVLEGRRLGVRLWLGGEGDGVRVMADGGTAETRAWLRRIRDEDVIAFGMAVAIVAAVERGGGDPERLRTVEEIRIQGVQ